MVLELVVLVSSPRYSIGDVATVHRDNCWENHRRGLNRSKAGYMPVKSAWPDATVRGGQS